MSTTGKAGIGGLLLGAIIASIGTMYFFDPVSGRRRRARVRDKLVHLERVAQRRFARRAHDAQHRLHGAIVETRKRIQGEDVEDVRLVERVRSAIGHRISVPSAIGVTAENGNVTLRGLVLADDLAELLAAAHRVRGVRDVVNELEVRGAFGASKRNGSRTLRLQH